MKTLDGPAIQELMAGLSAPARKNLLTKLGPHHLGPAQREVLEVLAAATPEELSAVNNQLFLKMDFEALDASSKETLGIILKDLPESKLRRLLNSQNRDALFKMVEAGSSAPTQKDNLETTSTPNADQPSKPISAPAAASTDLPAPTQHKGIGNEQATAPPIEDRATARRLRDLTRILDGRMTPASARQAHTRLAEISDPKVRQAVVQNLDEMGRIERMLNRIGPAELMSDALRPKTMAILSARQPDRLKAHAQKLASHITHDLTKSPGEALFALHLLKALPSETRQHFVEGQGAQFWTKTQTGLRRETGMKDAAHFYQGDPEVVRGPLSDPEVWTGPKEHLQTLVRMAQVAGEGAWAFEQSKAYHIDQLHPDLSESLSLYAPGTRESYTPPALTPDIGPAKAVGEFFTGVIDNLTIVGRSHLSEFVGVSGLDLSRVEKKLQEADLGIRFDAHEAGTLDLRADPRQGVVEVDVPELHITSMNDFQGELKLDTKDIRLQGLQVRAHYPTATNPKPPYMTVEIDTFEVRDPIMTSASSIKGAEKIKLQNLSFSQAVPAMSVEQMSDDIKNMRLPVPVLGDFVGGLARIVSMTLGGADASGAKKLVDPSDPTAYQFDVGQVELSGVADTSGTGIDHLVLDDLHVRGGPSRSAELRAQLEAGTDPLIQAELKAVETIEAEITKLRAKYRDRPKTFTEADDRRLEALQKQVTHGGYRVTAKSLDAQGIRGAVEAKHMRAEGLHAETSAPSFGHALITEEQVIRHIKSPQAEPTPATGKDKMHVDRIDMEDMSAAGMTASKVHVHHLDIDAQGKDASARVDRVILNQAVPLEDTTVAYVMLDGVEAFAENDELVRAHVAETELSGVRQAFVSDPKATSTGDSTAVLETLNQLDGTINIEVPLEGPDKKSHATARIPIQEGTIDPKKIEASTYFEPQGIKGLFKNAGGKVANMLLRNLGSLQVADGSMNVRFGPFIKQPVASTEGFEGFHPDRGTRGEIDVRTFLEGVMTAKTEDTSTSANTSSSSTPLHVRGQGLHAGPGQVEMSGMNARFADAPNDNFVSVESTLGEHLEITSDRLRFDTLGLEGQTFDLEVGASRLDGMHYARDTEGPTDRKNIAIRAAYLKDVQYESKAPAPE